MKRHFTIATQLGLGAQISCKGMLRRVFSPSVMSLIPLFFLAGCLPGGSTQNGDARGITGLRMSIGQRGQQLEPLSGGNISLNLVLSADQKEAQLVLENDSAFAVTVSKVTIQASNAAQIAQQGLMPGAVIAAGAKLEFTLGLIVQSDGSRQAMLGFEFAANGQRTSGVGCGIDVAPSPPGGFFVINYSSTINIPSGASYQGSIETQPQVVESDGATFSVVQQAALGTVVFTNAALGEFTYTPDNNRQQTGQDGFMFSVTEDNGFRTTGQVRINFTGVPASDIPLMGSVNHNVMLRIPILIAQGHVILKSLPQSGSLGSGFGNTPVTGPAPVTLDDSFLTYTPSSGTTSDSFTYQVAGPDPSNPGQMLYSRIATVSFTLH